MIPSRGARGRAQKRSRVPCEPVSSTKRRGGEPDVVKPRAASAAANASACLAMDTHREAPLARGHIAGRALREDLARAEDERLVGGEGERALEGEARGEQRPAYIVK